MPDLLFLFFFLSLFSVYSPILLLRRHFASLVPSPFLQAPKSSYNQSLFFQHPLLSCYCSSEIILRFLIRGPIGVYTYQAEHPLGIILPSASCVSDSSIAGFWAFDIYTGCPVSLPPFSLTTNYWCMCEQHTLPTLLERKLSTCHWGEFFSSTEMN